MVRSMGVAALVAVLVSCGAEDRQRSSTSSDSAVAATDPVQPTDTAASQARPDPDPGPDPEPGPRLLTPDGWGPLRIGMTRAEVVAAAGEDANPEAVGGPDPASCDEFRPLDAPEGVLVMIQDGVLTRITVSRNPDISTPAGFRVGDSGSAVLAEYGARARVEPHKYWESPARYVTVWNRPSSESEPRGIRYEIDAEDRVVHLRGGGPSIEYVEGCL